MSGKRLVFPVVIEILAVVSLGKLWFRRVQGAIVLKSAVNESVLTWRPVARSQACACLASWDGPRLIFSYVAELCRLCRRLQVSKVGPIA